MKNENLKVLIIHGFEGAPNGGWRPWLLGKLGREDIYAASLVMQNPAKPLCKEWIKEIETQIKKFPKDKIILIGHSLGVPAILNFLEKTKSKNIIGSILVSGPYKVDKGYSKYNVLKNFFPKKEGGFNWDKVKKACKNFYIIHGANDGVVKFSHAEFFKENLNGKLISVPNGGHLNGSAGWYELPQALSAIKEIIK
jgi:predicted alpha/beta hydrolase family esterase